MTDTPFFDQSTTPEAGTARAMAAILEGTVALAAQGATVALAARRKDRLDTLAANIRERGGAALVLDAG